MSAHIISVEAPTTITVGEYLRSSYEPDCEYVDGRIEERNLGEYEHAKIQTMLLRLLSNREEEWSIDVVAECRLQVSASRFRVPDVMVLSNLTQVNRIVRVAPLICIEVLSPEDTWKRLKERVADYLALGVQHIWVFDPETREAFTSDAEGFYKVIEADLAVPGTAIRLSIAEVFRALPTA